MEVRVEVCEFVGQDVSIWNDAEGLVTKFFLHFDHVSSQSVLPRELEALREVIYFYWNSLRPSYK